MSQRLPTPGGDDGDWGIILNDFLEVSLNSDGTIQTAAITQAGGELTANKGQANGYASLGSNSLVPTTELGTGAPGSSNYLRGDGTWSVPASGSSSLASDSDVNLTSPSNGQVLTYNGSDWVNEAVPSATSSTVGLIQLSGDFGGTATSPTVTKLQGVTVNAATPTNGQVLMYTSTGTEWVPSTVSSTTVSDATTSAPGIVQLSGDIGNTATDLKVLGINGVAVSGTPSSGQVIVASNGTTSAWANPTLASDSDVTITSPATNQVLTYNGSKWVNSGVAGAPDATSSVAGLVELTGDFGGSYNNPQVVSTHLSSALPVAQGGTGSTTATGTGSAVLSASPALTGAPTAPTATSGTNTTQLATTAFVQSAMTDVSGPDATSSTPGLVELTGDFGGTYNSPTVVNTHLVSALPIAQGGTGSTTQNFVDLTTSQSIAGTKTFTTKVSTAAFQLATSPTSGYVLTSDSSGNGTWSAAPASFAQSVNNISTNTTAGSAANTNYVYLVSGATTLTLPTAVGNTNRYSVTNVGTGTVTIATTSSQTINGSAGITMAIQYQSRDFVSNNSNWIVE